jgi:hypothetical protein
MIDPPFRVKGWVENATTMNFDQKTKGLKTNPQGGAGKTLKF